jgi:hypothetical protein
MMKSRVKPIVMVFVFVGLAWGQGKKATLAEQKACYDQAQSVTTGRTASEGGTVIAAVEHYRADERTCYVLYGWSYKDGMSFMLDDAFEGMSIAHWFKTSGSAKERRSTTLTSGPATCTAAS